jgi:hypothetical protein
MSALHIFACTLLVFATIFVGVLSFGYRDDRAELRKLRVFMVLLLLLAVIGLSGCATAPNVPKQVIVTVEKFKPLPAWATDPLAKPEAADGSVGARVRSEAQRGIAIDLANCHRRLLKQLDAGQPVDPKECAQP